MYKHKTNEQKLIALIKSQSTILNALICERLLIVAELTKTSIENEPDAWQHSLIHHSLYIDLCNNIQNSLK